MNLLSNWITIVYTILIFCCLCLQTEVALMYDGVFLTALALHEVGKAKVVTTDKELSCSKSKSWADGLSVLNYIKTVSLNDKYYMS
jgi:hypothetical protein